MTTVTVLSLSAKGLTHGEISAHLREVYGTEVSKQTISGVAHGRPRCGGLPRAMDYAIRHSA